MAKSFKDKIQQKTVNPALQFLTQPEELSAEDIVTIADTVTKHGEPDSKQRKTKVIDLDAGTVRPLTSKDIAAISRQATRKAPQAKRAIPQFDEETKSRRLQLLLTPSLYEAVKDKAAEERMSVNEYINSILKDATRK